MQFMKRTLLFIGVNFLVVLAISLVLNLLNIRPFLQSYGLDYGSLAAFCLIWGMGGAFISLALSRKMAKWLMRVEIIDPNTDKPELARLIATVYALARQARLPKMPQVGIYNSPDANAFATGPTRKRALVAVSSGLLHRMSAQELEGVLAHEMTHIANGDMVTMTLLQGVVNAFVMFLARILAYAFSGLGRQRSEQSSSGGYGSYMLLVFLFEVVFMVFGSLVVAAFSRWREYRADAGGAKLAGKEKMLGALQALLQMQQAKISRAAAAATPAPASIAAMQISTPRKSKNGFLQLFSSHPPLEQRIERLNRR